jgi:hypothetical protein
MLLLLALFVILDCQKVRLGLLNVRSVSVRTLPGFNITESISLTLTSSLCIDKHKLNYLGLN